MLPDEPRLSEFCEQRKKFVENGKKVFRWVKRPVAGLPSGGEKKQPIPVRCAYCHGPIRIHLRQMSAGIGPEDHAEHTERDDADHCMMGDTFTPPHHLSNHPVE